MITLSSNTTNNVVMTLVEKKTLTSPYYLLELVSNQNQDTKVLRLSGDSSLNVSRYNRFPIVVTGASDENLDLGYVNLEAGTYDYYAWESGDVSLALSAATGRVEWGKLEVIGTGSTSTTFTDKADEYTFY